MKYTEVMIPTGLIAIDLASICPDTILSVQDTLQTPPRYIPDTLQTPQNMAHFDQSEATGRKGIG